MPGANEIARSGRRSRWLRTGIVLCVIDPETACVSDTAAIPAATENGSEFNDAALFRDCLNAVDRLRNPAGYLDRFQIECSYFFDRETRERHVRAVRREFEGVILDAFEQAIAVRLHGRRNAFAEFRNLCI